MRNRLAILLAERDLNITKVANDTGISRNTITSIYHNKVEMMRLHTLQTLCDYLQVTPNEFFNYNEMHEPLNLHENWER